MTWLKSTQPVSTHSRPKAAAFLPSGESVPFISVSTHSRPKAAANAIARGDVAAAVSTHSRPKAAANLNLADYGRVFGFNTQPPEGGCCNIPPIGQPLKVFNTQPPEGGCEDTGDRYLLLEVSTHSRPKAAAGNFLRT